ncbi:MAG: hypothetical protein V5A64_02200 [Candidatus Thermoplasmatota archaeon]
MKINRDLIQILIIVIIGMFIPFIGSLMINFNLDVTKPASLLKIGSTFGYFLLIFGVELLLVFIYFHVSNKISAEKIKRYNKK